MDTHHDHEHHDHHDHEHAAVPGTSAQRDYSAYFIPASILIGACIIASGLYFGLSQKPLAAASGDQPAVAVDAKNVKIEGVPFVGNKDAKVTMVYWFDYQCPFCKAVEVGGIPQIKITPSIPVLLDKYVNTGKMKIVFMDFTFLGNDSTTAAQYEHAVWELYPEKFFDWHQAMFKAQDEEGDVGFGNEKTILSLIAAQFPSMDTQKLKALVASKKDEYQKEIDAEQAEGAKAGVTGTPGFVIGNKFIGGAVAPEEFTKIIDAQL